MNTDFSDPQYRDAFDARFERNQEILAGLGTPEEVKEAAASDARDYASRYSQPNEP